MGGLDLPDIKPYQWSAHLRYISDWVAFDNSSTWLDHEQSLSKFSLWRSVVSQKRDIRIGEL